MKKTKKYILLHLNVLLFSFTGIFSKAASVQLNQHGLHSLMLYVFLMLMILNCFIYALAWQKVIRHFDLNVAYAHKTVYLIWSQIWAVVIFHENLSLQNIIGLLVVFVGVMVVQHYE